MTEKNYFGMFVSDKAKEKEYGESGAWHKASKVDTYVQKCHYNTTKSRFDWVFAFLFMQAYSDDDNQELGVIISQARKKRCRRPARQLCSQNKTRCKTIIL
jgi:hypothetical protein